MWEQQKVHSLNSQRPPFEVFYIRVYPGIFVCMCMCMWYICIHYIPLITINKKILYENERKVHKWTFKKNLKCCLQLPLFQSNSIFMNKQSYVPWAMKLASCTFIMCSKFAQYWNQLMSWNHTAKSATCDSWKTQIWVVMIVSEFWCWIDSWKCQKKLSCQLHLPLPPPTLCLHLYNIFCHVWPRCSTKTMQLEAVWDLG